MRQLRDTRQKASTETGQIENEPIGSRRRLQRPNVLGLL
jgi:hypothetical protein